MVWGFFLVAPSLCGSILGSDAKFNTNIVRAGLNYWF